MWVTMYNKIWVIWRWWKKSRMFKNWHKLDQTAPPECDDIFDHLQVNPILAHMIACTNKASFPRFIFFEFFINL